VILLYESALQLCVIEIEAAVVKNAVFTQKLGINKEPKLIFYRNASPILYDGNHLFHFVAFI